jgi:hypothetical protein
MKRNTRRDWNNENWIMSNTEELKTEQVTRKKLNYWASLTEEMKIWNLPNIDREIQKTERIKTERPHKYNWVNSKKYGWHAW